MAKDWREQVETLQRGAAGGASAGALLSLVDLLVLLVHDRLVLSGSDWAATAFVSLAAGLLLGGGAGAVRALMPGRRPSRLFPALALALLAADVVVLPRLYPFFHQLLALGAVTLAGFWGADRRSAPRGPGFRFGLRMAATGTLVLGPLPVAVALVLTDGAVRETVLERTRLARHLLAPAALFAEAPSSGETDDCPWPAPVPPDGPPMRPRASVLLFTIDALRADRGGVALSTYMPKTAARLAGAWRFDRVYAGAPRSNESVYSLFTGRPVPYLDFEPTSVDLQDIFLPADPQADWQRRYPAPIHDTTPTLAETLTQAGYATAASVGYVYFLPGAGIVRGFQNIRDDAYRLYNRDLRGITSPAVADTLLAQLAARDRRAPLFLWAHFMDPHAPYEPYPEGGTATNETEPARLFAGELRRADDALDRVLSSPDLPEDRIVVLTGDHGEEFGEHGGAFHGTTLFEEQVRVPVWLSGVPDAPPAPDSTPLALYDLMPTLLDLVGVAPPSTVMGRSWVPRLRGGALPPRPVLMSSTLHHTLYGAVLGKDKLIVEPANGAMAYYDLAADPEERENRVDALADPLSRLACIVLAASRAPHP